MTTFFEAETGPESSRPRECFKLIYGQSVTRISAGDAPVTIGVEVYEPGPVTRGQIEISPTSGRQEMTFTLPLSHPISRRWSLQLLPPKRLRIEVRSKQLDASSPNTILIWSGRVTTASPDFAAKTMTFKSRSLLGDALDTLVPNVTSGPNCPHKLYDAMCKVPKSGVNRVDAIASIINGATITLNSDGGKPDQWALWGELTHVDSGESQTVIDHVGNTIKLRFPIPVIRSGDAVVLYRGCAHTVTACLDDFNNVANMGGQPHMPTQKRQPFSLYRLGKMLSANWGDE